MMVRIMTIIMVMMATAVTIVMMVKSGGCPKRHVFRWIIVVGVCDDGDNVRLNDH